jgi:hypothetical protein
MAVIKLVQKKAFGSGSKMKADVVEVDPEVDHEKIPVREQPANNSLITKTVLKGLLGTSGHKKDKDIQGESHE